MREARLEVVGDSGMHSHRSMLHDPEVFPEPERFMPERYLKEDGTLRELERHEDPSIIGFGFGRRCVLATCISQMSMHGPRWVSLETDNINPDMACRRRNRICPGMFFAMNSIFIGIATMLYVFDISKSRDERGREIVPDVDFRGFIRCVSLFALSLQAAADTYPILTSVSSQPSRPVPMRNHTEVRGSCAVDQKGSGGGIISMALLACVCILLC